MTLCHKHSPAAIFLTTLHVLLLYQLRQQFLHRHHANTCRGSHIRHRQKLSGTCPLSPLMGDPVATITFFSLLNDSGCFTLSAIFLIRMFNTL